MKVFESIILRHDVYFVTPSTLYICYLPWEKEKLKGTREYLRSNLRC
jgi:hypothetical protein